MQRSHGIPTGAGTAGVDKMPPRARQTGPGTAGVDKMPPWARQTGPGVASKWIVVVLRRVRRTEEAPSAAWTGAGARPGKPVAEEIKACPLRVAAVVAEAAGAEVAEAVVAAGAEAAAEAAVAAAAGNLPGTTHPLSKGGKSHGAIH
jgi:hypothetical protein